MSVLMGLEKWNKRTGITVLAISLGVALASYGELNFVFAGFIFQCLGIAFEATRLVAIQKLLQGLRMDPLVSLYYVRPFTFLLFDCGLIASSRQYAPVCATLNFLLVILFEGREPFDLVLERVGPFTLFLNCNVALLLNVSVVYLIGCASSLVLTLSGTFPPLILAEFYSRTLPPGVLKDVLLVAGSVVLFGSQITFVQMVGYSIALGGLFVFVRLSSSSLVSTQCLNVC
jgi:hypothetical protein